MKAIRQTLKAIYKNALKFDHAFIVDTLQAQRSSETLISDDLSTFQTTVKLPGE